MPANEELINRIEEKAHEYEKNYSGCAQSVLGALQAGLEIGNDESFRAATGLAGGIARQGESCGAIIGALMALGLAIGRERIEDVAAYRAMVPPAIAVREKFMVELEKEWHFKDSIGSTLCRRIQEMIYGRSFDLTKEAEFQAFLEAGGHSDTGCPRVCAIAARTAAEKILELT